MPTLSFTVLFALLTSSALGQQSCASSDDSPEVCEGEFLNLLQTKAHVMRKKAAQGAQDEAGTDENKAPSQLEVDEEKKPDAKAVDAPTSEHQHKKKRPLHIPRTSPSAEEEEASEDQSSRSEEDLGSSPAEDPVESQATGAMSESKRTKRALHIHGGSQPTEEESSLLAEDQVSTSATGPRVVMSETKRTKPALHTHEGSPPTEDEVSPSAHGSGKAKSETKKTKPAHHTHEGSPSTGKQSSLLTKDQALPPLAVQAEAFIPMVMGEETKRTKHVPHSHEGSPLIEEQSSILPEDQVSPPAQASGKHTRTKQVLHAHGVSPPKEDSSPSKHQGSPARKSKRTKRAHHNLGGSPPADDQDSPSIMQEEDMPAEKVSDGMSSSELEMKTKEQEGDDDDDDDDEEDDFEDAKSSEDVKKITTPSEETRLTRFKAKIEKLVKSFF